jgi:hypothetical protein
MRKSMANGGRKSTAKREGGSISDASSTYLAPQLVAIEKEVFELLELADLLW